MYKDETEYNALYDQNWLDEVTTKMTYDIQTEIDKELVAKITNLATTYQTASSAFFYYPPQPDKLIIG